MKYNKRKIMSLIAGLVILLCIIAIIKFKLLYHPQREVAKNVLKTIYEVSDYNAYQELLNNYDEYLKINSTESNENSIIMLPQEIYQPYIEKFKDYATEDGLADIFAKAYYKYVDELAYNQSCYVEVEEISLDEISEIKNGTQFKYLITIHVKSNKLDKQVIATDTGIIDVIKSNDSNYKVNSITIYKNRDFEKAFYEFVKN